MGSKQHRRSAISDPDSSPLNDLDPNNQGTIHERIALREAQIIVLKRESLRILQEIAAPPAVEE